jgi:hypothetical protein
MDRTQAAQVLEAQNGRNNGKCDARLISQMRNKEVFYLNFYLPDFSEKEVEGFY